MFCLQSTFAGSAGLIYATLGKPRADFMTIGLDWEVFMLWISGAKLNSTKNISFLFGCGDHSPFVSIICDIWKAL